MRKKSKSAAILAVVMAMTLAGSSAVYAEENSSAKTAETDDNEKEDTRAAENEPAPCNEGEHELIESKVVLPTCTESILVICQEKFKMVFDMFFLKKGALHPRS